MGRNSKKTNNPLHYGIVCSHNYIASPRNVMEAPSPLLSIPVLYMYTVDGAYSQTAQREYGSMGVREYGKGPNNQLQSARQGVSVDIPIHQWQIQDIGKRGWGGGGAGLQGGMGNVHAI